MSDILDAHRRRQARGGRRRASARDPSRDVAARRARAAAAARLRRARCAREIARGQAGGDRRGQEGEPEQGRAARAISTRPTIAASYERARRGLPVACSPTRRSSRARPTYLAAARAACALPALRKDFIVDEYQVAESRALGADAILLIVARARRRAARATSRRARTRSAWPCWSRCTTPPSSIARSRLRTPLVGINNRNLRTFEVSLETTLDAAAADPAGPAASSPRAASSRRADVRAMRARGVHAFLVGEAFMRADDPGVALAGLLA